MSILSSCFVAFCIMFFRKTDKLASMMVLMLLLADMLASLSMIGNPADGSMLWSDTSKMCKMQAFVMQFATSSSNAWVASIAFMLHQVLFDQTNTDQSTNYTRRHRVFCQYFLMCNAYALITALLPAMFDTYGDAGPFCWISDSSTGHWLRYICYYIPTWCFMLLIIILFGRIIREVRGLISQGEASIAHQMDPLVAIVKRLAIYPTVMFICFFFPSINRIHNTVDPQHPSFALYILTVAFSNLNGVANALVFGMTSGMAGDIQRECCPGALAHHALSNASPNGLHQPSWLDSHSPSPTSRGGYDDIALNDLGTPHGGGGHSPFSAQEQGDEEQICAPVVNDGHWFRGSITGSKTKTNDASVGLQDAIDDAETEA